MNQFTNLPAGSVVRDDHGVEWKVVGDAPPDDGSPAYYVEPVDGRRLRRIAGQRPIVAAWMLVAVVSRGAQ